MRNLYDILGLSSSATALQIEQAYLVRTHGLKDQQRLLSEAEGLELRAVEEAYALLSSPARRERYDQKLKAANQPIRYEVVEPRRIPWLGIALVAMLVLGAVFYYQNQQSKARIEQLRLEEARTRAEAEQAEQLAIAESKRLEREKLEREERLARQAQIREEYAARASARQQTAAMERALNRPIEGSNRRPNVVVIPNEPARPAYAPQR
ncbi:hypothetical protein [Noviherbaspirillum sedimenti]|uniref:J domain-containing protein n=1 Tax=Noviherbaspirillum sedimenti TaxID=2320865 RepID=A0A3A3G4X4_9BURK|nr:hypothetical protein [Noviherbaspirillum sedimenti]RJG02725.1 hypothetical protein D3878_15015 [Noviherbaspirillum sedimenti]